MRCFAASTRLLSLRAAGGFFAGRMRGKENVFGTRLGLGAVEDTLGGGYGFWRASGTQHPLVCI